MIGVSDWDGSRSRWSPSRELVTKTHGCHILLVPAAVSNKKLGQRFGLGAGYSMA